LLKTIFVCMLIVMAAGSVLAQQVSEIRVQSRDRAQLDGSTVTSFISVREGDSLSRDALNRDVRALQKSGRFSYVAVNLEEETDGYVIIFTVQFKPIIRHLTIDGADYLGNQKVRNLLDIGVGDPVDDMILSAKSIAVKDEYRKKFYPYAGLEWTIATDPQSGGADVRIQVIEGKRAKVSEITFVGNNSVESSYLRKVMQQRRRNFMSWLTGSGSYNPDVLSADMPVVRDVYVNQGFLDVKISKPEIKDLKKNRINIIIDIEEGSQYRLGEIDIQGISLFSKEEVFAVITNQTGDVASNMELRKAGQRVRDYYGSRGYIDTRVSYRLNPDLSASRQGDQIVDVVFTVKEGRLGHIRNVSFRGNTRTRDKVLRREITIYPGEIVNEVKVRTSERRLKNLGFYKSVSSVNEPTDEPGQYDVVFEFEEQKTGQFLIGAGFSSIDNLIGFAELSHGNFDLFNWPPVGGGQKLRLRGTLGTERTDVEFSITEPWFLDRRLALGFSAFKRNSRFLSDDYEQVNTGGRLSLGVPVGRFSRLNFIYGLEEIEVTDIATNASEQIFAEEGTRLKSSLTTEYIFDTRNNPFVPTRGVRTVLSGMYAGGALGGETDIYSLKLQVRSYFPLWFDHVLSLRGWTAAVDTHGDGVRVPIFDRLFLGGARTLRGFDFRDVGPKDENGEPLGGYTAWFASAEYTIPVSRMVRLAAFYDMGMVYDEAYESDWGDYNSDYGLGVRFDIPGFPLRFDYAWPVEADEFNDNSGRFQFTIGYSY